MSATIKKAERILKQAGYSPGAVDGKATANLTNAVKEFQGAIGLQQTGALDAATMKKLDVVDARIKRHKGDGFINVGQKGESVLKAEKRLRKLGYDVGKADGIYSEQTAKAVRAFRADQANLKDGDGWLSKGAQTVLFNESQAVEHAPQRRRYKPVKTQAALDKKTAEAAKTGIDAKDRGQVVANVQKHLRAGGFDPKHTNGVFDERTAGALKMFQRKSGLPATGVVDSRTWGALKKTQIFTNSATAPAQRYAEKSGAVKASEQLLKKLGYKTGIVDGYFSRNTEKAMRAFEKKNKLKVDGAISTSDLKKLKSAVKKKASNYKTVKAPPNDYRRVRYRGVTMNVRTRVMVQRAEKYLRAAGFKNKLSFSQGSYSHGVGASKGTHDGGGALDIRVGGYSRKNQLKMVKALRQAGFAAWTRHPDEGFSPHIHAIAIGDKQSTAKYQVSAYFRGRSGLVSNRLDRDRSIGRPIPNWAKKYR